MSLESELQQIRNGLRAMAAINSFQCPVCGQKLDLQGVERGTWTHFDLWCHNQECRAHVTVRIPK